MNTYFSLSTAKCTPDQVPAAFNQIVDGYMTANPEKKIIGLQHATCSIGSPMSPYVVLSVQFTATDK
ncbi:hypothetical protein MUN82_03950 [Hymenobacter aerilatus]|uniref:Uncharacterized protein n=1 Tax=Hymenobacter aerilatus TaxID=2932251 RepID=A0A8T9SVP7_9BACT|nr:hypothetical protein [Hymenobacter aerilatus]UOR06252.1 hypothetical protein MUN82_03950 [Hymenobacter aerilatus]